MKFKNFPGLIKLNGLEFVKNWWNFTGSGFFLKMKLKIETLSKESSLSNRGGF